MADHADTVRDALKKHHLNTSGVSRSYNPTQTYRDNQEASAALAALDALVAERDRYRDALLAIAEIADGWTRSMPPGERRTLILTTAEAALSVSGQGNE